MGLMRGWAGLCRDFNIGMVSLMERRTLEKCHQRILRCWFGRHEGLTFPTTRHKNALPPSH